jgi:WD40 repeat protein
LPGAGEGEVTGNPYVGPRPIADAEHPGEKIWGRDREILALADLVVANRIVLVYSPSGAGKTSLLMAGLLPNLTARRFAARPPIRANSPVPPGVDALNRYTLSVLLSLEEPLPKDQKTPIEKLARMTLVEYLTDDPSRELLVFDQFEEVLTADPLDHVGREAFFTQLGQALSNRGRWAVFAMREDYLGPLDRYTKHIPTRLSHTYRLDLLTKEAALESVTGPAAALGVTFDRDAAWRLVDNLSALVVDYEDKQKSGLGEYVEPVQLQVVCRRLWGKLDEGTTVIGAEHIGDLQSVDQALGDYYADTVAKAATASGVAEQAIRAWFGHSLITEQKTRRQVSHSDEATAPVQAALQTLRDAYLIRADRRVGQIWYELAHDRLIRPVIQNNDAHTPELQRRAELWDRQGRRDGLLLSTLDYKRLNAERAGATPVAVEFLDRSRGRRTLRFVMWTLETLVAIGMVATVVLAVKTSRAIKQLDKDRDVIEAGKKEVKDRKAELKQEKEDHQKTDIDLQHTQDTAKATLATLDTNIHLAASTALAAAATAGREGRFDLAALLAVEAWNQAHTFEAHTALFAVASANPRLRATLHPDTLVNAVAFGPGGLLAMAGDDGAVWLWDVGRRAAVKTARGKAPITAVSVNRDGIVASGDGAGNIRLWDGKTGAAIAPPVKAHRNAIGAVHFEAGGRLLISGASDGVVRFWAVQARQLVPAVKQRDGVPTSFDLPGVDVAGAAFSLATREAIVLTGGGSPMWWNLDQPAAPLEWGGRQVVDVGMLDSGKVFAGDSADGVYLFDKGRSNGFQIFDAVHHGPFSAATISADGKVLAAGVQGRTIHIADVKTSGKLPDSWAELKGPADECRLLALTPDGSMLASVSGADPTIWIWDLRRQLPSLVEPVVTDTFPPPIEPNQTAVLDSGRHSLLTTFGQMGETLVSLTRTGDRWKHLATIRLNNPDRDLRPPLAFGENGGRPFVVIGEVKPRIAIRSPDLSKEYASISADQVVSVALSHDGKLLAVLGVWGSDGRRFHLYSLADLSHPVLIPAPILEPPRSFQFQVTALALSPVGNLLVLGGQRTIGGVAGADAVNLWDLQNPTQPRLAGMLTLGAGEAKTVAFSPDGGLLATAADYIKLWEMPQPGAPPRQVNPRATLPLPFAATRLAFSPDGALLAASYTGRRIVVLETTHGTMLGGPIDLGRPTDVLGFEPDGQGLLLWSDRALERIRFKPDQWVHDLCARANRNLTPGEWKMFLSENLEYHNTCPDAPGKGAK